MWVWVWVCALRTNVHYIQIHSTVFHTFIAHHFKLKFKAEKSACNRPAWQLVILDQTFLKLDENTRIFVDKASNTIEKPNFDGKIDKVFVCHENILIFASFLSRTHTHTHKPTINHTLHTIFVHTMYMYICTVIVLFVSFLLFLTRHFGQCLINRGCPFWMTILWRLSTDFAARIIMPYFRSMQKKNRWSERDWAQKENRIIFTFVINSWRYSMNM